MASPVPIGTLEKGVHIFPVRVYYEDTDAAGVVYYANYLRFAERARTEMLRILGIESARLGAGRGLSFAVSRCHVDYLKPARLDDALEVHTTLTEVGHASLSAEQIVKRDGVEVARLALRIAVLDQKGRPARLPSELRNLLVNLSQSRET